MELIIENILKSNYKSEYKKIFDESKLLQYIDTKIRSVGSSPKSRLNIANLYAIYVLIKDYQKVSQKENYKTYSGSKFTPLLQNVRSLPFGSKMQNHSLNHRCNMEFKKISETDKDLIIRKNQKYKINLEFLIVNKKNISESILGIIKKYVEGRIKILDQTVENMKLLKKTKNHDDIIKFFQNMLSFNSDARLFEITSFAILKNYYSDEKIFIGKTKDSLEYKEKILYKTGRTNANDGGIDFVMKPLGNFYQVTESLDFNKYFLDIDKINRYPITFIVKSNETPKNLRKKVLDNAKNTFDEKVLKLYDDAIEEIINIPILENMLKIILEKNKHELILEDFEIHLRTEFNFVTEF